MNRRLASIILAIAGLLGFTVGLILAVGFAAHGSPDKWLGYASGVCTALALLLALV